MNHTGNIPAGAFPSVSVVIPCYNAGPYITATIQSVLDQAYAPLEILVINDGSTDNSKTCLLPFAEQGKIQYIEQENRGVSAARNRGLDCAKGRYILFLDADDLLAPGALATLVHCLESQTGSGFASLTTVKINEQDQVDENTRWLGLTDHILEDILGYNETVTTCPSAYLFRKELLIQHTCRFNESLSSTADRFFMIELAAHTAGTRAGTATGLYYRVHPGNMSGKITPALLRDNLLFRNRVLALGHIEAPLRKSFVFKTNYIFAGCYYRLKKPLPFLKYLALAFFGNPVLFIKQLTGKKRNGNR